MKSDALLQMNLQILPSSMHFVQCMKIPNTERAGGVAQVVECLPSKRETLRPKSKSSRKKERKKKIPITKKGLAMVLLISAS
jgi:hypothetical protein